VLTIEERVAFVEGPVQEHSQMFAGLPETITSLEQRMDRRFDHVAARFTVLEEGLNGIEVKLTQRVGALEQKVGHQRWLVGLQVTTMLVVLGMAFAR
jgi:uncharacterized coiled-coil protein SlyX